MARKTVLTALLLPLPFAALPLLSVMIGYFHGGDDGFLIAEPVPIQRQLDRMSQTDDSHVDAHRLAYGMTDPSLSGCEPRSTLTIDG